MDFDSIVLKLAEMELEMEFGSGSCSGSESSTFEYKLTPLVTNDRESRVGVDLDNCTLTSISVVLSQNTLIDELLHIKGYRGDRCIINKGVECIILENAIYKRQNVWSIETDATEVPIFVCEDYPIGLPMHGSLSIYLYSKKFRSSSMSIIVRGYKIPQIYLREYSMLLKDKHKLDNSVGTLYCEMDFHFFPPFESCFVHLNASGIFICMVETNEQIPLILDVEFTCVKTSEKLETWLIQLDNFYIISTDPNIKTAEDLPKFKNNISNSTFNSRPVKIKVNHEPFFCQPLTLPNLIFHGIRWLSFY